MKLSKNRPFERVTDLEPPILGSKNMNRNRGMDAPPSNIVLCSELFSIIVSYGVETFYASLA
jgi:hypothetical protein